MPLPGSIPAGIGHPEQPSVKLLTQLVQSPDQALVALETPNDIHGLTNGTPAAVFLATTGTSNSLYMT